MQSALSTVAGGVPSETRKNRSAHSLLQVGEVRLGGGSLVPLQGEAAGWGRAIRGQGLWSLGLDDIVLRGALSGCVSSSAGNAHHGRVEARGVPLEPQACLFWAMESQRNEETGGRFGA